MGSETLQGGSKKAFQHLQSNQKNHRREIQSAHGRECATDRPQKRFGKAVDKLDNRAVIWELEPREYDRDENDQRVEIDNIGQNHTFRSFMGAIKQRYQIRHRNRSELRGYQALRSRAGSRSGAPGSNIGIRSFR